MLGEGVLMRDALEIPDVDGLFGRRDQAPRELLLLGLLRRELLWHLLRHEVRHRPGLGRIEERVQHGRAAVDAGQAARVSRRGLLAREGLEPTQGDRRVRHRRERTGREELEELPPARFDEGRVGSSLSHLALLELMPALVA